MSDRNYVVNFKNCFKRGKVEVLVRENTIKLRGEREAVAQAAWFALLGKNELGEDVDKKLSTRLIIMEQLRSQPGWLIEPEVVYARVYGVFKSSIRFTWISIARG